MSPDRVTLSVSKGGFYSAEGANLRAGANAMPAIAGRTGAGLRARRMLSKKRAPNMIVNSAMNGTSATKNAAL